MSSAESEYRGLATAAFEIAWIQSLLIELCLSPTTPPLLWCDNQSATHLAVNPVFHARTKHIELDLHFIHDKVLQNQLRIQYLPSSDQIADIFTKHISSSQFFSFRTKLSVVPKLTSLRGDDRPPAIKGCYHNCTNNRRLLHQQQSNRRLLLQLHQQQKAVAELKNCASS